MTKKGLVNIVSYSCKKYMVLFFSCLCLICFLYISMNDIKIKLPSLLAKEEASSAISTSNEEDGTDMVNLLARIINGEARGEPYEGQVAVGAVIMNRVRSSEFPNTIAGVIYQKGQFTAVTDGQFDKPIAKDSTVYKAAREALNGSDPTGGALYFYDPRYTKSKYLFSLKTITTIGNHRFAVEWKWCLKKLKDIYEGRKEISIPSF